MGLGLEVGVGEGVEAWVCRGLWLRWWWWWWWGFRFGVGGLWVVGQGFRSAALWVEVGCGNAVVLVWWLLELFVNGLVGV